MVGGNESISLGRLSDSKTGLHTPLLRLAGGSDPGLSRGTLLHGWPRASVSLLAFPQGGIDVFREPQAQEGD